MFHSIKFLGGLGLMVIGSCALGYGWYKVLSTVG